MATAAPAPTPSAKPSVPAPAVVAPVAPAFDPDSEIAQLKAKIARLQSLSENPPADENRPTGPETIDMGGLVLRKTVDTDGKCETEVLKKPMINRELIRATKATQHESGF
jgi:hypothetical protein